MADIEASKARLITCSRCGHHYEDTLKLALEGWPVCPTCAYKLTAPANADGRPARPKGAPEPRFFHFDTDVYERRIGLAVGPLKEMGAAWLTERLQEAWPDLDKEGRVELDDVDETVLADVVRIQAENGKVIRIVRIPGFDGSPYDHGILAHETFHLVCGVLKDLGVPHDDNEEAHAYFFEFVYRRFLELLRGKEPVK